MTFVPPPPKKQPIDTSKLQPAAHFPLLNLACFREREIADALPCTKFSVSSLVCSLVGASDALYLPVYLGQKPDFYHKRHSGIIRHLFSWVACQLVLLSLTTSTENAEIHASNNSDNNIISVHCRPSCLYICSLVAPHRVAMQQRINNMTSESHLQTDWLTDWGLRGRQESPEVWHDEFPLVFLERQKKKKKKR